MLSHKLAMVVTPRCSPSTNQVRVQYMSNTSAMDE